MGTHMIYQITFCTHGGQNCGITQGRAMVAKKATTKHSTQANGIGNTKSMPHGDSQGHEHSKGTPRAARRERNHSTKQEDAGRYQDRRKVDALQNANDIFCRAQLTNHSA